MAVGRNTGVWRERDWEKHTEKRSGGIEEKPPGFFLRLPVFDDQKEDQEEDQEDEVLLPVGNHLVRRRTNSGSFTLGGAPDNGMSRYGAIARNDSIRSMASSSSSSSSSWSFNSFSCQSAAECGWIGFYSFFLLQMYRKSTPPISDHLTEMSLWKWPLNPVTIVSQSCQKPKWINQIN